MRKRHNCIKGVVLSLAQKLWNERTKTTSPVLATHDTDAPIVRCTFYVQEKEKDERRI